MGVFAKESAVRLEKAYSKGGETRKTENQLWAKIGEQSHVRTKQMEVNHEKAGYVYRSSNYSGPGSNGESCAG